MKYYEGMFLFDPAVTSNWDAVQAELQRIMGRAGARVITSTRWDERRLAYEIRGRKRAVYVLCYFEADPLKISGIERDVQLSEAVIRCLVLRVDHLSEEEMLEMTATTREGRVMRAGEEESEGGHREERSDRGPREVASNLDVTEVSEE